MGHMRVRHLLGLCLLPAMAAAVSCGGSSGGSATAPSGVATITGITITANPPGIGATVSATATAQLSSGNTVPITSGFTSDALGVVTVTSAGAMTGVSIGDATITVLYQGFSASRRVHVLPNYNGIFSGTYTLDSCTETGGFANQGYCASLTAAGSLPLAFNNLQSPDLTTLSGQFALGSLIGTGNGAISSTGTLTYAGSYLTGTGRIDLQNMTATVPGVGLISGHFEQLWTDSTAAGQLFLSCTIHDLTRVSGGVAATALPSAAAASASSWPERLALLRSPWRR